MADTILILACSRKPGGRCVAGKVLATKQWVRLVGNATGASMAIDEAVYTNSYGPQRAKPLIKIEMNMGQHVPLPHQPENFIFVPGWTQSRGYGVKANQLALYTDSPENLWGDGDRVSDLDLQLGIFTVQQSLYLVVVGEIRLSRNAYESKRVEFVYNGIDYALACTDLNYEQYEAGILVPNGILCISLGEDFHGDHYKIVATIFGDRAQ